VEQTGADAHTGFGAEPNRSFGLAMADVRPAGPYCTCRCIASKWTHVIAPALAAGGTDNRAPGFARTTTPTFNGTFLLDPMATISRLSVTSRSEGSWFCWT